MMTANSDKGGESGRVACDIFPTAIQTLFSGNRVCAAVCIIPGREEAEAMKSPAFAGEYLNEYISRLVRFEYADKRNV